MPAKAKKPAKKSTAWQHGKHVVQLWLTPEQREKIEAAAEADMRPMTQILIFGGLTLAEKLLKKCRNSADSL